MKLLHRHTVIRGRFWLQLWTLKKFSEPRVLLNEGSKEVENGESWTYSAVQMSLCRLGVCRACIMCRNLLGYSPCTDLELIASYLKLATSGGQGSGAWFIVIECIVRR